MAFDVDSALKAGYSRSEIADYLASQRNFDVGSARKAGYSDDEILSHLAESGRAKKEDKPAKAPAPAPAPAPEPPPSADPIDYSAAATSMQGEPSAAPSQGLIASVGKALRPEYRSVMEDYKPTPQQDQANRDQRLSYGAGPIRPETAGAADLVRSGLAKSEDPTVNRVAQVMQERGEPGVAGLLSRAKDADPDRFQEAARRDSRREFAKENPLLGSLAAGSAGLVSGAANIPSVAADAFNQTFVNPVLQAVGLEPLARVPNAFGTEYLAKAAEDFMPKIGKQEMGTAWNRDEFAPWLMSKLAANSPQIAQSLLAAFVPPLRAVLLPGMAGTAAGQSFAQGDDSRVAVAKGAIEYATEKLPLGVFDKIGDALKGMSVAKQNTVMAVAGQRLLQSGAAVTANTLTNAIEETTAQFGGNVLDKYFQGKDIELSKGLAEAAVVGGATGKLMSAPQVAAAATGYYEPERQIAREIERNVANTQFTQPADQAARTLLDPQTYDPRMVSPELTVDPAKIRDQVSQATTVDSAVAAAENAAGTINVNIPAPLTAPVTPAIPAPMPQAAAPVAPDATTTLAAAPAATGAPAALAVDPAVEQQFGFDKLRLQPAAAPAPMNAPRPQRIQGTPVDQLTDEQLDQIAGDESIPAITRRGASVELTARRSGATMEAGRVEPTLNLQSLATSPGAELSADGRVEPTLTLPDAGAQPAVPGVPTQRGAAQPVVSYRFAVIPQQPGVRDIPATSVGGTAAAQRAREAAQRSVDKYAAQTGRPVPAQFNPAPPELDAAVNEIAQAVNSQFGGRIYAYSDARPEALNGIAIGKIAFVNTANVDVNAARTSLHEFKHTIEQIAAAESRAGQTGTAAQKFVAEIDSIYDDMTEAGKRAYLENFLAKPELDALYNPATGKGDQAAREARLQELLQDADGSLRSEMTADFLGNRATDKQFWQEVAAADPEGFRGFVEKWLRIIDNLLAQLRGTKTQGRKESARVDKYVRDLNKAKMVAREALIAYSKATRGQQQQVQAQAASAPQRSGREATAPGSIGSPVYDRGANAGAANASSADKAAQPGGQGVRQDGRAADQDGRGQVTPGSAAGRLRAEAERAGLVRPRADVDSFEFGGIAYSLRRIEELNDVPEITMQDLVDETVFPILADLTAAGYVYMGKELRGGPFYTLLPSNSARGLIWANDAKGVSSIKEKKAARGVIGLVVAMKQDSHATNNTISNIIFRAVEDAIQRGDVAKRDIPKLDKMVRGLASRTATKKRKVDGKEVSEKVPVFPRFAEFPGFSDRAASEKFLREMPFEARGLFFEEMSKGPVEDMGLGAVRKVIQETIEPELRGLNMGDVVLAIRFTPGEPAVELGPKTDTPLHDSYRYAVKGEVIGKFKRPISFRNVWVDLINERASSGETNITRDYRSLTLRKPEQLITQEIADRVTGEGYRNISSPAEAQAAVAAANNNWTAIDRPAAAGVKEFLRTSRVFAEGKAVPSYDEAKKRIKDGRLKIFRLAETENWFSIERRGNRQVMTSVMVAQPGVRNETLLGDMINLAKKSGATHIEIGGTVAPLEKVAAPRRTDPIIEELSAMTDNDLVNLGIDPAEVRRLSGVLNEDDAAQVSPTAVMSFSKRQDSPADRIKWRKISDVRDSIRLDKLPEHIVPFANFMQTMADKAANGGLTSRDVIKAYTIARSSMNRGAVTTDKVRAAGLKLPPGFADAKIRPEGAFGYWLLSPQGQRYLNGAEVAVVDDAAIADAVKVMAPFGTQNALGEDLRRAAGGDLHTRLPAMTAAIAKAAEGKNAVKDWQEATDNLYGVREAKKGFLGSLLGFGQLPTFDARQINVNVSEDSKEDTLRALSSKRAREVVAKLSRRMDALSLTMDPEYTPFYRHLVHHAVWDAVGGTATTHEDVIESMLMASQRQEEPAAEPTTSTRQAEDIPRGELAGRRVSLPVLIEDTGQTATITLDAKEALDDVDEREGAMQRLLECLRK